MPRKTKKITRKNIYITNKNHTKKHEQPRSSGAKSNTTACIKLCKSRYLVIFVTTFHLPAQLLVGRPSGSPIFAGRATSMIF